MFRICMCAFLTWLFFNMNGVIEIFGGIMGKNVRVCRLCFFIYFKVSNKQGVPGYPIIHFCYVEQFPFRPTLLSYLSN